MPGLMFGNVADLVHLVAQCLGVDGAVEERERLADRQALPLHPLLVVPVASRALPAARAGAQV